MFAATKVLHASHVVVAKILTGKAIVTAGVLAGTLATGYVVESGVPPRYVDGAAVLINDAALNESPALALALAQERSRRHDAEMLAAIDPALPHLVVSAHRMTRLERAEYDAGDRPPVRLAEK